ncbi:LOB domain-containing protein 41 [Phtheirospermum japonicum]|uniref:LOB domain-containing protein 41 n=1 Tax=Phtheirospermum japonicum TaxID=374723 RepID=A0A830BAE3_9LAMI|nr:LOB domain-containing protein 41 [Phtheirospermum japonicum]
MRMSCNGCRVLRKGCNIDCSLGPCLQWIKSPESQANATLFLAKFYGRAGLLNLINAGPTHLRPEIFRSLLYEACGRIINPVYGAVGLMCSGDWTRCQAAVEAVLAGAPLVNQAACVDDSSTADHGSPLQVCDIRHLHRARARKRGKNRVDPAAVESEARFTITGWTGDQGFAAEKKREPSHDSFSVETVEPTLVNRAEGVEPGPWPSEIGLELTLGRDPVVQTYLSTVIEISDGEQ